MRRQDITARQRNSSRSYQIQKLCQVLAVVRTGCVRDAVDLGDAVRCIEPGVGEILPSVTSVVTGGDQSGQSPEHGESTLASVAHDALQ